MLTSLSRNSVNTRGLPGGSAVKSLPVMPGDAGSIPGSERSPGGGYGNPLQYSCWENSHGQKSLVGHSLWGHKELDTTEAWQGVPHTEESTKFLTLSYLVFLN